MTIDDLYLQIRVNFGINNAIRIKYEGKDLSDGDTIFVFAKEASVAFQVACIEFEKEYKSIQKPTHEQQMMYVSVQKMKSDHGI